MRKEKVFKGENTASQLREELNVELIHAEANPEQGVINQDATELEQFNELLGASDVVSSEGFESELDRKGPWWRERP